MKSFLESKAMAKALRQSLAERNIEISHGECLELVAKQFGFADWNVLSAQIESAKAKVEPLPLPPGWLHIGFVDTQRYRSGLDPSSPGTAMVECTVGRDVELGNERFAGLGQSIDAEEYRGRKLRLTANLRAENANVGTIWLRVDGQPGSVLRFDNMLQREIDGAIYGTSGWIERMIVLDVPDEAQSIHYGFFMKGYGKVWARNFRLKIAPDGTETTNMTPKTPERRIFLKEPSNLDFMGLST
ncbi:glyoxalase superfamily protein [Neorhizobium alkalisoli]|uniref:glyoxalase superfamily protein n=1 Tax=Neorhizobium alkalisoli TaxID=528178 RepID=UPI000CF88BAB|nr:glyoxalase superfamily protein [Neorhizobium alkalisoli]